MFDSCMKPTCMLPTAPGVFAGNSLVGCAANSLDLSEMRGTRGARPRETNAACRPAYSLIRAAERRRALSSPKNPRRTFHFSEGEDSGLRMYTHARYTKARRGRSFQGPSWGGCSTNRRARRGVREKRVAATTLTFQLTVDRAGRYTNHPSQSGALGTYRVTSCVAASCSRGVGLVASVRSLTARRSPASPSLRHLSF